MPKYDAFGREIGEDTLSGWRTREPEPGEIARVEPEAFTGAPPPQESAPPQVTIGDPTGAVAQQPPPSPPAYRPPMSPGGGAFPVRRRRRRRSPIISLLIIGGIVFGAVRFVDGISGDVADRVSPLVPNIPEIKVPEVPAEAKPPVGLRGESMIRAANLRKSIADLEGRGLGTKVWTFRLAPERIDTAFVKSGRLHTVQLRFDGSFQKFSVSGATPMTTVNIARLDVSAPQRLVRAAAGRMGKPTTRIDYLVPSADGWIAYFKGNKYFAGDRHGRRIRQIG